MEENICVTVRLVDRPDSEQPEPFFIEASLKWRDLEAMIRALYETPQKEIDVRYLDDENDQVMISCEEEFLLAIRYCKDTENVLQLTVRSRDADAATSEVIEVTCPPTEGEATEAEVSPDSTKAECPPPAEEQEHVMVPGATSGANAVAIEMPECPMEVQERVDEQAEKQEVEAAEKEDVTTSHQTEAAEPAEMAETGEIAHKSGRDAETGYWMVTGDGTKKRKTPAAATQKTGLVSAGVEGLPIQEKPAAAPKNLKKRDRQTEALAGIGKAEKRHKSDKESKEDLSTSGPVSGNMSFPAFVAFMGKLKKELRSEIVHDVTRKTVKQVLRGLESLQLQAHQETGTPQEVKTRANNWPVFTHDAILCDNCERTIVGPRYKCGNCLNYDLCEECENQAGVHDENHVFLKLRRPCHMAGYRHGKRAPLLKHLIYTTKIIEECAEPEQEKAWLNHGEVDLEKLARKREKLKHMELKMKEKVARKEEKLKRRYERLSTQFREQLPLLKKERIEVPYGTLNATFVRDVTLPDGIEVEPGVWLTKTWRMGNSGTMAWPPGTVLRLMWTSLRTEREEVPVPQVAPGAEVDITVHLLAPSSKGRYESYWHLVCNGKSVGHRVYCIVKVERDLDEEPEAEPATAVVPMLKELCSDNMENLSSKMTQLTISVEQQENEDEPQEDSGNEEEKEAVECEDEAGVRAGKEEPLSVAGMNDMLSFVMVDVERPERPRRPPPQVVKQSYDDKEFWVKKLSALPGQGEPATPNNTPLDVSPPPERTIPIPEPELLRKLSLEAEASPQQDAQESDQAPSSELPDEKTAPVNPEIKEEKESAQSSSAEDVSSLENIDEEDASPATAGLNLELLEPTPVGPHQEIEGEVLAATENGLQAGRHLYDEGEVRPGQTPENELRWWEDRESSPVSTASSVEVVSAGELEGDAEAERTTDLSEYMAQRTIFPPHGWTEELAYDHLDVESLDSLSDDSSFDEDFFIVKLPDCFDLSKPLVYDSALAQASSSTVHEYLVQQKKSADEVPEAESKSDTEEDEQDEDVSQQPSLDDMLQASGSITTPTLIPTAAPTSLQAPACSDTSDTPAQVSEDTSNVEAAAGEFQDAPEPPAEDGTPSSSSSAAEATSAESAPLSGERPSAESGDAEGGAAAGATGAEENPCENMDPSQQVNQLMQSAVAVASKAAVRAFTTAKDVFYTLQARQYEWKPSTWKPPQSTWKPTQSRWTPPESEWKPPANTWKPPADEWKPPSGDWRPPTNEWKPPSDEWQPPADDWQPPQETLPKEPLGEESGVDGGEEEPQNTEPMARLWEMGFFNRDLNQRLLDKHNGDLEPVVQELLQNLDNDWAEMRH
ncbi:hypothetical protein BaRGS_00007395 [Batillaria attramentaria]|uniref:Next to BRCA1 gene 1 protein-like n=1 Tax=Batillaria attramentaria TaxID=370345 RepID=A0ABD0LPX7_9CAEN